MRKYLIGTGILPAVATGVSMLRGVRNNESFTWRTALAWLSWGITLALAIGAIVDTRRASRGKLLEGDSPLTGEEKKYLKKRLKG